MQNRADALTFNDGDLAPQSGDFTCKECGKVYAKPILATIVSAGQTQEYYACPKCLSKAPEAPKAIQEPQPSTETLKAKKAIATEKEVVAGCGHYFGYLRKREKSESFPDECLSCSRMVDCLMR